MRFRKEQRLRKTNDFQKIRERGVRVNCGAFLIQGLLTETELRRFGIIVSKRVSKSAVVRNRLKRVFREIFRLHQDALPKSCDIVVICRRSAMDFSFKELETRYLKAFLDNKWNV